jgi:hypothetical protein
VTEAVAEINECRSLFLADFQDLGRNGIRVVVAEGLPAGPATSIDVAGTIIPNCTPIEATDQSRIFEIVWRYYVGYSVLNESYAAVYDAEQYEGTRFRIYSNGDSAHGQRAAHTRPCIGLRLVRDRLDASGGKFRLEIAIQ